MKWFCLLLFTGAALAQEINVTNRTVTFTNLQGRVFENVTITKGDLDGIIWRDGAGGGRTYYTNLPPALLESWGVTAGGGTKRATKSSEQPGIDPEQRLLAAFPQLRWPRAKLEFEHIQRARVITALAAGADQEAEAFRLAKEIQAVFRGEDRKIYSQGWRMVGRLQGKSAYFENKKYTLSGMTGELQLLYDGDKLTSLSFYTDGSDAAYGRLRQLLVEACAGPGRSTIYDKDTGEVKWTITGSTLRYDVKMSQRKLLELERGVDIFPKNR